MMRKAIFVECANKKQVQWWNDVGSKLVKTIEYREMIDNETGSLVGVFFVIAGILTGYVEKMNASFMSDRTEMTVTI